MHIVADRPEEPTAIRTDLGAIFVSMELSGAVAGVVGIEGGVVSGVFNLESSGVRAPDWRPRHDKHYHDA